jgi:hypothetical protein
MKLLTSCAPGSARLRWLYGGQGGAKEQGGRGAGERGGSEVAGSPAPRFRRSGVGHGVVAGRGSSQDLLDVVRAFELPQ